MTARQRRRLRPRTVAAAVLAAAALVLTLAACGGSSESPAVASIETTGSTDTESGDQEENSSAESDPQEVLLEFTQCLRDEGIDVEDPNFNGGGGPGGGGPFGDVDMDDPEFQAAQEACSPILESLRQQFEPEDQEAIQDAALEYAQCMRENGVDMEDPDFSNPGGGGGPGGGGPFGDVDRDDPDFQAADETCRAAFGGLRGPGPAGDDS